MSFFEGGLARLAASAFTKSSPAYVQFYVTARCNLACVQCNIIYANADVEEVTTEQCRKIAENLAKIGTSVVLLTGGEPFVRKDLPEICRAFLENGIHPRIQTNGLATRAQLEAVAKAGVRDVSISLDSLEPGTQDAINGGFDDSWTRALRAMSLINEIFPAETFAALGCVLSPRNISHVVDVIRFGTEIGWWISLVPAHVTTPSDPRNFSTYDTSLLFEPEQYESVRGVLEQVKRMRGQGYNVYDSDEYIDDIYRYITRQPIRWRRRNGNVCDSPNLYFAIQPNGDMSVCCDYRLPNAYPVYHQDFPQWFHGRAMFDEALSVTQQCTGCMYGSFPEISVSARFFKPMMRRAQLFLLSGHAGRKLKPLSVDEMVGVASAIRANRKGY